MLLYQANQSADNMVSTSSRPLYIYIYIYTLYNIYIYIYTLHARTVGAELRVTVGRKSAYDSLAGGLTVGATSTLLERFFTSINLKEF